MIKHKFLLFLVLIAACLAPSAVEAQGISISIGDRPYYHGARYWDNQWEMVWVPGYQGRHRWVRGHYVRGQQRRNWRRHDRNINIQTPHEHILDRINNGF